ncbi:unnamed protein product, partial [Polarella glacialis]
EPQWWQNEEDSAGLREAWQRSPECPGVRHALSLTYRDPATGRVQRLAPGEIPSLAALRGIVGNNAYGGELYPLVGLTLNVPKSRNFQPLLCCQLRSRFPGGRSRRDQNAAGHPRL